MTLANEISDKAMSEFKVGDRVAGFNYPYTLRDESPVRIGTIIGRHGINSRVLYDDRPDDWPGASKTGIFHNAILTLVSPAASLGEPESERSAIPAPELSQLARDADAPAFYRSNIADAAWRRERPLDFLAIEALAVQWIKRVARAAQYAPVPQSGVDMLQAAFELFRHYDALAAQEERPAFVCSPQD